jgi:hypothetical protein
MGPLLHARGPCPQVAMTFMIGIRGVSSRIGGHARERRTSPRAGPQPVDVNSMHDALNTERPRTR